MINGLYKPNVIRGQPGPGMRKWHKRFNTRHQLPQLGGRAHLFWFSHKGGLLVRAGLGVGVVHGVGRVLFFGMRISGVREWGSGWGDSGRAGSMRRLTDTHESSASPHPNAHIPHAHLLPMPTHPPTSPHAPTPILPRPQPLPPHPTPDPSPLTQSPPPPSTSRPHTVRTPLRVDLCPGCVCFVN